MDSDIYISDIFKQQHWLLAKSRAHFLYTFGKVMSNKHLNVPLLQFSEQIALLMYTTCHIPVSLSIKV